ncbi:asparaginase domain-containing protein [Oceanisphaera psychrotolerans]|uniref:Asparaginase n=1 Tax=Oceanisphaera psychrotolerans TaxID=1414654 RepID=A0A1J4QC01_9GAMM|nr:asparaginase domain-containing protein [Oceanisphaera psychrotolerans]OIN04816.1 asparaginase [Oceanisphaera psychrotolerans]
MNPTGNCKIQLVITGGTIDSRYDTDKCTTVPHEKSVLDQFLDRYIGIEKEKIAFTELCMKDSREITPEDIKSVSETIMQSPYQQHVVTHGTFTMFSSARHLQELLPDNHNQVVVFTGSMIPLEGFSPNDAGFNLGSAIMAAQCLNPGVYIAFHGRVYRPEDMENLH